MPKVNKYNVYDNGELVLEEVTHRVVVNALGCPTINVAMYAIQGTKYKHRYLFELCGTEGTRAAVDPKFEREWNAAVALFKNVIWVKKGGRRLRVGRC